MSAEIVNLRQVRKQRKRTDKEKQAEDNRRKFGRTKEERDGARRRREHLENQIDSHRLPGSGSSSETETD
ncbi:DUF4169 family protein [Labrenzia sp. DG1229]|uniref:DUF4169 family protein n=1 Tax=Labrenzia sp. DG1229 TaxID=681847 RepID=UPI00048D38F1|nr:DUF4169 family protein [Labrenzia sp. DG1229]